ncbi:hypothetical protein [Streptomyces niveiscabiei]|uniref:hypothetical protein n=1 Tax=Streptomyces niveiscabiei TaxID=164115 RepID=UPI0038F6EB17
MTELQAQPSVPWAALAADPDTVQRYRAKVYDRGPDRCAYWLGAISDSGHGKLRAGSRKSDSSRVVTAHVLGYVIVNGADALREGDVVRHGCDESSCQLPSHWGAGIRLDNIRDYYARSHRAGHALNDARGPAGRARAIRDAILATQAAVAAELDSIRRTAAETVAQLDTGTAAGTADAERVEAETAEEIRQFEAEAVDRIEAAIAAAIAEGNPTGATQDTLF